MKYLLFVYSFLNLLISLTGCGSDRNANVEDAGCLAETLIEDQVMGTAVHMVLYSDELNKSQLDKAAAEALEEIKRVERLMSSWVEDSDVSRINAAKKGEWVEIDRSTIDVLANAMLIGAITNKAFDITVSPLVDLWGFGAKSKGPFSIPSDEEISEAMRTVGHGKVLLDIGNSAVSLAEEGMTIDLGGIAKGYAVDRALSVLYKNGVDQAMVEVGGEVGVIGKNKDREKWCIGVRHPLKRGNFLTVLELENEFVGTSGDYENFFVVDGVRYSHIIDPRTGRPTTSNITSVTVVGTSCAKVDALATGFSVLQYEDSIKILESLPDIEGIIVRRAGDGELDIYVSEGLRRKIRLLEPATTK